MRQYKILTESYEKNAQAAADCSGILFINKGSNEVRINDIPLAENETLSYSQDGDGTNVEVDRTIYNVNFAAGAGTNLLFVVRKKYLGVNYER